MKIIYFNNLNYINNSYIILGMFQKNILKNIQLLYINKSYYNINDKILEYNFKGKLNTHIVIPYPNNIPNILIIGCGNIHTINISTYKKIIRYSWNIINNNQYSHIIYHLYTLNIKNIYFSKKIQIIINIFEKLNYNFNIFRSKQNKTPKTIYINWATKNNTRIISLTKHIVKQNLIICKGIKHSKNLSNLPANICNSYYIAKQIQKKINNKHTYIKFLNKQDIINNKMYAYLAVGQGSHNKPLISIIHYQYKCNIQPIILIGKGVTFDSGGISLKPALNMHHMKYDMAGASAIYGIMYIITRLKLKLNIIGILSCTENMLSSKATRPGDIVTSMSKKTIEITNTDAEGRLILCDTLTYVKKYNPNIVIDIATLTGACSIALGDQISGLMSNNRKLTQALLKASKISHDYIWELPIFKKYKTLLTSKIADIKNCASTSVGGTIVAAYFLSLFTKKYKWAHLDIANTAWNKKGATGRPIKLIIQFLLNFIKNKYQI